jgi:hypothetical protein
MSGRASCLIVVVGLGLDARTSTVVRVVTPGWGSDDMDGLAKCSVQGHGGHLFGDMVDTSGCSQVDFTDPMRAEEDAAEEDAIVAIG